MPSKISLRPLLLSFEHYGWDKVNCPFNIGSFESNPSKAWIGITAEQCRDLERCFAVQVVTLRHSTQGNRVLRGVWQQGQIKVG
jgi:hypothetical protein